MDATHLLWTSGWDSTFRLLCLVRDGRTVQPYYMRDSGRGSWKVELETQGKIKQALGSPLILSTIIIDLENICPHPDITASYDQLCESCYIGRQYELLSRMARDLGISDLELSVHLDDRLYHHLKGSVRDGRMASDAPSQLAFFKCFRFPLLTMTKRDMEAAAEQMGLSHIMEMTWFCHNPVRGKPCGMCNPCRYAIGEGMGRRIPLQGRLRGVFFRPSGWSKEVAKKILKRARHALLKAGRG